MVATANDSKQNSRQFGSITARRKQTQNKEFNIEDYNFLAKKDRRMRFNTSRDPIYYVFNVIENRPIPTLAKEFVKDSFKDLARCITRVVR